MGFADPGPPVKMSTAVPALEESRAAILKAIGDPVDLTLVRPPGNLGDELIHRGTAALLSDHIYREIDVEQMCAAEGDTALLMGGGAFCRAYHEVMPRALAVAELRFARVIVLPSSFDIHAPAVREALARTRATVFARELVSQHQLESLCDVRLAHDGAFFVDYGPWRRPGSGVLNAFRTDAESSGRVPLPPDNDDISLTASDLDQWLERIAGHEVVRTDRAHVMIAAALTGKRVEYAPSAYHKVTALAEFALADYPVTALELPADRPTVRRPRPRPHPNGTRPRVSAVILSHNGGAQALRAIDSLTENDVSFDVTVLDQDSAPPDADILSAGCAGLDHVMLRRLDQNLGCAGGRRLGSALTRGDFVLFLDDDAELTPGSLDALVADLDAHPEAHAVSATVAYSRGDIHHSGGLVRIADGVAEFSLVASGQPITAPVAPSGPAHWVPGTAALFRRPLLEEIPIDDGMAAYFEDNEWAMRVRRRYPDAFRRSAEARAIHMSRVPAPVHAFAGRSVAAEWLGAHACFYERHGLLLGPTLFSLVPELVDERGGRDLEGARLLMELVLARGTDWLCMEWMNGGLDTLIGGRAREVALASSLAAEQAAGEADRAALAATRASLEATRASLEAERTAREHQAERLSYLEHREATLEAILGGGWWRLRNLLTPVLAPLRRRARR